MSTRRASGPREGIIGWREWVALPELGVPRIKAKADTGARSSALHAFDVEVDESGDEPRVHFKLHPTQRDSTEVVECEARLVGHRWVRPSTGKAQLRPVIRTTVRLGKRLVRTEITLVRRDLMGFRMLLGRRLLKKKFLVDSGRSFLAGGRDREAGAGG